MQENTMLIVDDMEISREILSLYFKDSFHILEAENGKEALKKLEAYGSEIDIILLDLSMPQMGGREFLAYRKKHAVLAEIPVVIITASSAARDQVELFEQGIDDYITKPFVPEVVDYRIRRVINERKTFNHVLNEKQNFQKQAELDLMTGIYNKETTQKLIGGILKKKEPHQLHAMLIFDIDKFKMVNDTHGHLEGDRVIKEVAHFIAKGFRKTDIVGRIGGDEFAVLMMNIPSKKLARDHANQLIDKINKKKGMDIPSFVTLSIGIAYAEEEPIDYEGLFHKADIALYECKTNGRNQYYEYGAAEKRQQNHNMERVYLLSTSRTTRNVLEELLEELELVTCTSVEELAAQVKKPIALFLDISEETDDGKYFMKHFDETWQYEDIPVIAMYQDGNMEQCKVALAYPVSKLLTVPINDSTVKRIMENLLAESEPKEVSGLG